MFSLDMWFCFRVLALNFKGRTDKQGFDIGFDIISCYLGNVTMQIITIKVNLLKISKKCFVSKNYVQYSYVFIHKNKNLPPVIRLVRIKEYFCQNWLPLINFVYFSYIFSFFRWKFCFFKKQILIKYQYGLFTPKILILHIPLFILARFR